MDCKACGQWFSSSSNDDLCPACYRAMKRLRINMTYDQLRELDAAIEEDREIIPPVAIGAKVFHITTCKNFPQVLDGTLYGADGGPGDATGLYCPCELAENCPFPCEEDGSFDCDKHKSTTAVFEDTVKGVFVNEDMSVVLFDYSGNVDFSDFGRTVFLTNEEAQAALSKWEG